MSQTHRTTFSDWFSDNEDSITEKYFEDELVDEDFEDWIAVREPLFYQYCELDKLENMSLLWAWLVKNPIAYSNLRDSYLQSTPKLYGEFRDWAYEWYVNMGEDDTREDR